MVRVRSHSSPDLGLKHVHSVDADTSGDEADDYEDETEPETETENEQQQEDDSSPRTILFDPSARPHDINTSTPASSTIPDEKHDEFTLKPHDLWTRRHVGLYASYAAIGLLSGMVGNPSEDACEKDGYFTYGRHEKGGEQLDALCDNLYSIINLPWNFKLVFAIVVDLIWPFGLRRKPYMVVGWFCVLLGLFAVGLNLRSLTHEQYLYSMVSIVSFAMVATVPSDGYAVQLALMGKPGSRMRKGSVLVTCYAVRFFSSGFSSFIHAFLMNGPDQNNGDTIIAWDQAYSWGITFRTYYFIIIALLCILFIPILMMTEVADTRPEARRRSFVGLFRELWEITKSKTVLYFLLFGFFIQISLTGNSTASYLQGYVISVPTLQIGMQSMLSYIARALGVLAFRSQLMHRNWRTTNIQVRLFDIGTRAVLWIMAFYNVFGLQFGWFTVYTNVTSVFLRGIVFMALPVAIIEISRPGMETTVYQLIIWVYNSSIDVSIQMRKPLVEWLVPLDELPLRPVSEFVAKDGPFIFTQYTIILTAITAVTAIIGCRFMPTSAEMVREWNTALNKKWRLRYGVASLCMSLIIATYSTSSSLSVLFPNVLECSEWFGGDGCGMVAEPE